MLSTCAVCGNMLTRRRGQSLGLNQHGGVARERRRIAERRPCAAAMVRRQRLDELDRAFARQVEQDLREEAERRRCRS